MGSRCPKFESNKAIPSRQSTLDKFVGMNAFKADDKHEDAQDSVLCDISVSSSVSIDPEAAKTWIYPENVPVRDYQVSMTRTALFSNTLVSLPTGLGKTLIAAAVMLNYYRWFPEGKIVFSAPSRPLVMQQLEACHNIVGIPQDMTVDMTGKTSPSSRVSLWKDKRVFFVTPQVLEKDIESGSCAVKQLVCLVIDEAHRASKNYSYCVSVRKLMAVPVQLRILALTATPGSTHQAIQQVIDNLQISSLEHRSENDVDVTPYVHDRKIDLIKVVMGKDADEAYSLLMSAIRPFVRKLSDYKVFPPRDPKTLSPMDLVNSGKAFHDRPPPHVPQHQYAEIQGTFSMLVSIYNIMKLLSSHGIPPALVMLQDMLKQGFGRFLSKNEDFHRAKALMQNSFSRGAFSPKVAKMLEVLVEHFKKQGLKKSRAIIFSHFRESVSDIISSLATIGEYVKAAEFVGQSSGKKSKGQTQKEQQAVLEKFRAGEYNVIVATSIGEEGLDIMEVDLVISFDANISPLRMIQRMGRTGRKGKGRVVVLACEGSELKAYQRKQSIGKRMKNLMANGTNNFMFHPSPRMVPHVFRPEKVLVKLSIEDFVHRGKKVKTDDVIHTPTYKLKLSDVETDLLVKYFGPSRENSWTHSLIAFPHFQAFPSRVHHVSHSMRTTMLIDTMQYLQGSSLNKLFNCQDEETSEDCVGFESVEHHSSPTKEDVTLRKEPETDILYQIDTSRTLETHHKPDARSKNSPVHSFLFGSDFTSVDSLGRVLILSVPIYPLNQVFSSKTSNGEYLKIAEGNNIVTSGLRDTYDLSENEIPGDDKVLETEISNLAVINTEHNVMGIPNVAVEITHSDDELNDDFQAGDLSPRLTNLLMSGVVPESPINIGASVEEKGCLSPDHDICLVQSKNDEGLKDDSPNKMNVATSSIQEDVQTPQTYLPESSSVKCKLASKFGGEVRTPLADLSNKSCSNSKDWMLSSGEKSVSQPKQRLKRLRKYGDVIRNDDLLQKEKVVDHASVSGRSCAQLDRAIDKHGRGNKKMSNDARFLIEDEAEASSGASGDEDVDNEQDSYDDSFIDDRINPTVAANTQAQASPLDMMAIYRRSLLTQSPIVDFSPDNTVSIDQTHDSGGSTSAAAATTNLHLHSNGESSSKSVHLNSERLLSSDTAIPTTTNESNSNEVKRRKLNLSNGESLPIRNLEREMFLNHDAAAATAAGGGDGCGGKQSWQVDEFDDDEFYQGIDFDALEEQATKQLRLKSQSLNEKPKDQNLDFLDCPSFDLGI
ncbi:DEAD-box ATP-dependent RNA helicase FANCM [Rutidosis leptorrhynchoides]|uniref:DEAD-box ATP-dependent RNA helicase FANCM n=1 Tax=Rutidosis leptorrhynchoides TaxID=125765 RepID=UPI003A9939A0